MYAPFYDKIKEYAEDMNVRRFHMPGHKGKADLFDGSISKYDVTEIDLTDDLYRPRKELLEAEKLASELFGVKKTVFCAGGATLGNQTALSFFAGKKVLFERNIHISAMNAAMMLDIEPVFVYNRTDKETGVILPIEKDDIERKLTDEPDIRAVFITSPNYYGLCADIRGIKNICKEHDVVLINDNSHGTHLAFFGENCPDSHCADIIIDSAHKTLPVLTGGAYIHFNLDVERSEICAKMMAFGSTSPSFLILSSLDWARAWCAQNTILFIRTGQSVLNLKKDLRLKGIMVVDYPLSDPLRLCIACSNAEETDDALKKKGIIPEMCDGRFLVFMFSPFNSDQDIIDLKNILCGISIKSQLQNDEKSLPRTVFASAMKKAFYSNKADMYLNSAIGMTAAEPVIPYPPGVPVLLPGELITAETAEYLIKNNIHKVKVVI